MELFNKIKWVLSVLLVFFLILTTNLIDKENFRRVKNSIVTIYEDRIVANDLIFEYLLLIHEKELAVASSDTDFFKERNAQVKKKIENLTSRYLTTKLTDREAVVFEMFREDLSKLERIEASMDVDKATYDNLLFDIKEKLNELSKIQLKEGRNQVALSKEAFDDVELFTQLEIYILIFLAIVVQIIILYKPGGKAKVS